MKSYTFHNKSYHIPTPKSHHSVQRAAARVCHGPPRQFRYAPHGVVPREGIPGEIHTLPYIISQLYVLDEQILHTVAKGHAIARDSLNDNPLHCDVLQRAGASVEEDQRVVLADRVL